MKNFGSVAECAQERERHLLYTYFRYIASCRHVRMSDAFRVAAEQPAPRFWVSARTAAIVISKIERGDTLAAMRPNKREMFMEIYRRYKLMRKQEPTVAPQHLIRKIVVQPAPKSYLSQYSAKIIIIRARKKWAKEKLKNLHRYASH